MPFSKIFPSSMSLNLLKKGLESPGKVLEFHLHQRVGDLWLTYLPGGTCASPSFGVCQQNCTDIKPGPGYYCVCRTGYKISPKNSHYCDDVNECAVFGTCGQKCENFKGSFKCSCYDGYQLSYTRGNTTCKIKGEIWPIITGTTQYFKKIQNK